MTDQNSSPASEITYITVSSSQRDRFPEALSYFAPGEKRIIDRWYHGGPASLSSDAERREFYEILDTIVGLITIDDPDRTAMRGSREYQRAVAQALTEYISERYAGRDLARAQAQAAAVRAQTAAQATTATQAAKPTQANSAELYARWEKTCEDLARLFDEPAFLKTGA